MPETLQLGPFMVSTGLLIHVVGIVAGFIMIKLRLKQEKYEKHPVMDYIVNGLLIIVIFWKLGPIIFHPVLYWENPGRILLSNGSTREVLIGGAIAAIYIVYKLHQKHISFWLFLDLLPYGILGGVFIDNLLTWKYGNMTTLPWGITLRDQAYQYHPVNVYVLLITVCLLVWLWVRKSTLGDGVTFHTFLMFFGTGLMLVSFSKPLHIDLLYLSYEQLLYIGMVILGYILMQIRIIKQERR